MRKKNARSDWSRGRRIAVTTMLVVGAIVTLLAVFSIWINRQALNTDNWVNTSTHLLKNDEIQKQMSTFLVTQLYANVNVAEELEEQLPPDAKKLAGPVAGGLKQLAQKVAERALDSPAVQTVWEEANRKAHESLLNVINGGSEAVSTENGEVVLELAPLVSQIGGEIGVPESLLEKLPPEAGNFKVLDSDQLSTVQKIAKLIRHLPIVLILLMIVLYVAALYLARGRRRETLRSIGIGFIAAGLIALIVRGIAGGAVVDALSASATVEPAAEAAWGIGTSLLVTVASSTLVFGILVVIGAWIAGPSGLARGLREDASPHLREHAFAAYGLAGIVWLLLILWAPVAAFHKPLGILIFAILFAVGAWLLSRQTLEEFPDSEGGALTSRVRGGLARVRGGGGGGSGGGSQLDQLERLSALHRDGALTDEEFASQKEQLLSKGS